MRYLLWLLLFLNFSAGAQALRDLNHFYLYNPAEPFTYTMKVTRTPAGWTAFYTLTVRDTSQQANQFVVQWDTRTTLGEKEGTAVTSDHFTRKIEKFSIAGEIRIPSSATPVILATKVLNNNLKHAWLYFSILESNYPVNGYLTTGGNPLVQPYVKINTPLTLQGDEGTKVVSFYRDDFPAAVPAFSEGMAKVSRGLSVDSTLSIATGQEFSFSEKGLYLIQKDTNSTEGVAFRVVDDYPRLAKVQSLADPLIYVCTRQEFDRVKAARGDKKAFDRVILGITGDADRAKHFMRAYFRRVELANQYFTSYKEGWKTDRGMIYIIFGLPEVVYRFSDREVWKYKNASYNNVEFTFVKSSTLFDPDNFVLIRDKKYQDTWYDVIDLWRNARIN
ncbi:GWxTD domain-containing protein [Chryseolinea lacunae]|uniref:GWxTD domain-containing protein n=1 Tax=Chryseolinea lacunae TaxID=2801331 RepID=A0ABS1KSK7_9BACT|nr:GWxTD domain-containing protein [Chryseolinea lacunae]MBL0742298.1 GWxTD domain-containing protein [Chryseolinea lacunae]